MSTTAETVIAILADKALLDPSEVTPDQSLADLGMDSLTLVEAIFAMEEAFDIVVPFSVQEGSAVTFDTSTVGAIIGGIETLLAQKAA